MGDVVLFEEHSCVLAHWVERGVRDATLVYLDASPSLDAALARVTQAGGRIALERQALPPGMGFFAHITDLDGNRVGLHALA